VLLYAEMIEKLILMLQEIFWGHMGRLLLNHSRLQVVAGLPDGSSVGRAGLLVLAVVGEKFCHAYSILDDIFAQ